MTKTVRVSLPRHSREAAEHHLEQLDPMKTKMTDSEALSGRLINNDHLTATSLVILVLITTTITPRNRTPKPATIEQHLMEQNGKSKEFIQSFKDQVAKGRDRAHETLSRSKQAL